jgi:hypothetical protein
LIFEVATCRGVDNFLTYMSSFGLVLRCYAHLRWSA